MKRVWMVSVLLSVVFTGLVSAEDIESLKRQLQEQQRMLQQMQKRLAELESKQENQDKVIDKKIADSLEEKKFDALPESLKWAEKVKLSGDLRYRHESIDDDASTSERNRNRIRARLNIEGEVNDEWGVRFRLASGSSDSPTSTNQTLGDSNTDSFGNTPFWIDMAYADFHPAAIDGFNAYFGKMANPFYKTGKNELIWDGDVTPEGIAASYETALSPSTSLFANGGGFWIRERSGGADTGLFGIQSYLKHKINQNLYALGGLSYYDMGNLDDRTEDLSNVNTSSGNTFNSSNQYVYDYDVVEMFAEMGGFEFMGLPATVYGNYVENTAAPGDRNSGWFMGWKLNKAKKPGDWQISYNYRELEKDAVFDGLTDSDFIGGGTDGKGHEIGLKYKVSENVDAGLTYFLNNRNTGSADSEDFDLLQADLKLKF